MSLPKITTRPQRVLRIENDPYRGPLGSHRVVRRQTYEDGSRALFVDNDRVCSICCQDCYSYTDSMDPTVRLGIENGAFCVLLDEVSTQERIWLQKSMEDTI